jgi:drug/metabolite transporter (DMT)-like permease
MNIQDLRQNKSFIVWASFLFLMLVWGSSFFLVKQGLKIFSPVEVASIRLSSAMVALIGLAIPHFKKVSSDKMPHLFISSIIAMGAPAYLFAIAQTPEIGISSSISGVLNAMTPLMTFVVGIIFFNQKMTLMKVIGLLMGFFGAATLILVNAKGQLIINNFGFFVLIATVCYGTNVNYIKRYLSDVPSLQISSITVTMVGLIAFCILMTTNFWTKLNTVPNAKDSFLKIVLLGVMGTAAAQVVFNKMLTYTSALFASSITYFIPIVAVLWGILDNEILLPWHYLGMALIIGGVLVMNKDNRKVNKLNTTGE